MQCFLCPRKCGADRNIERGFCGAGSGVLVAKAMLHHWEEPCISGDPQGERGSGAVFFSGCPLQCCFCQNYTISVVPFGKELSVEELSNLFLKLQNQGAYNLNLVSPTPYIPQVAAALKAIRPFLSIPVVYNSSGYERVESLQMLKGLVDIYLPDLKYFDPARSARYAEAENYFEVASLAIKEMFRQVGSAEFSQDGMMKSGMIIRHLVLPHGSADSIALLDWIATELPTDQLLISVMSQYTPMHRAREYPEISHRLTSLEYKKVLDRLYTLGITRGYTQQRTAAKEEYTPEFNLSGL